MRKFKVTVTRSVSPVIRPSIIMEHELHTDTGFDALRSVTALLRGEKYEGMISRTSSVSVKVVEIENESDD